MSYRRFAGYVFVAVGIVLIPILVWKLSDIILLGFGGVMIASLLRLVAEPFQRYARLPNSLSLAVAGLLILGAIAGTAWLFEARAAGQFKETLDRIEQAIGVLKLDLGKTASGQYVLKQTDRSDVSMTAIGERFVSTGLTSAEALVLVVITAVFVAAQPIFYEEGTIRLFPVNERDRLRRGFQTMGRGLRLWLIGQLISMTAIGLLAGLACWLIGVHTPYALGLIAALCEFVPYVGAIMSAVPALLVALTQGPDFVIWTAGAYLALHQFEGNLLMPLIQRQIVSAPPALLLIGIAVLASLFGLPGLIFGAPIVIVSLVAVKAFYMTDVLHEDVSLPSLAETPSSGS